ncbi:MAG TPA: DUF2207 domain-containing protein [Actinophytocola sp.]|uniref:DUF2207 domain-containing protein n=1 Tax=Actinophytocola sp. TaxID=1872138 RepID=UPI002DBB6780|nr:DUF2207 domain-containing protein [Actinophytocola sp.]HEU5471135.1 DUF2207 domain-containing protein [Actinophytocola sp.]
MSANWGIPAAALVAVAAFGAAQPSIPPPPEGGPSIDLPVRPKPSGGTGLLEPTRPPTPSTPDSGRSRPLLPQSLNIALKIERDGALTVTEQVFVQARSTMTRRAPLRIRAGADRERVFAVRDVRLDGNGSTEVTADELVLRLGEGASTVTYTVDGAVTDLGDRLEARWQVASGWDVPIRTLRASFIAPDPPQGFVCLAGATGSDTPCESAGTDHRQVLRVVQQNLAPGNRIDLAVDLPAQTVPAGARFDAGSIAPSAFAMTTPGGIGLGALFLLVLAGFLVLWRFRGRDARALATEVGPVDLVLRDGERVAFASPDGLLPGQIGTVVDERVDPADLAATVVDLAVRNYLWIAEAGAGDWRLVRRNPPDEALTGYERAVLDALLPAGAEQVTVAALSTVDLSAARSALYADVVARGWLRRRPDREQLDRLALAGAATVLAGIALTLVLALTVGHALVGLAVLIGGVAVLLGTRWLPGRTRRGSVLVQQIRGVRGYLATAAPDSVPEPDRASVGSRSLPYAVVLGDAGRWLSMAGPGLYWYEGQPGNVPKLLGALTDALNRGR